LRATPAVLPVVGFPLLLCHRSLFVGKLLLWGRLSSLRPAFQPALAPFTHRPLRHPMPRRVGADQRVRPRCSLWSMPPGLPCRPLRGARSLACHTGSHAGGRLSSPALPQVPVCGQAVLVGQAFQPALVPFTCCLCSTQCCRGAPMCPPPVERAASLATPDVRVEHAARLAMPAVTPAERYNPDLCGSSKRHPARNTAHSTSSRRPPMWSKPPGLPCRRSRRQSHTIPSCTGVPIANRRQNWRRGTHDCALHLNPPLPLPSPCPPCSLWFAFLRVLRVLCGLLFPCPPHPQSQPFPNLFPFPFQPLAHSPFLSSCSPLVC